MKYRKTKFIGKGGFGKVWCCWSHDHDQLVAVKELQRQDAVSIRQFWREASVMETWRTCPHTVDLIDAELSADPPYIVMEYLPEGSLHSRIHEGLDERLALWFTRQMAEALNFIHSRGGFHRDVKPLNMLVKLLAEGEWTILLSDFGLARDPGLDSEMTREARGTPAYKAPELHLGAKFTSSCDIFSLGISLVNMLRGDTRLDLFADDSYSSITSELVRGMTATDPAARPTAAEVVKKIDAHFETERARNQAQAAQNKDQQPADLTDLLVGGLVVLGLVGLGVALFGKGGK